MAKDKPKQELAEEPEAKVPEEVKQPVDKPSLPKFINNTGKDIKIRLGKRKEPNWITVEVGESVEIPRKLAKANKLQEVK